jgi:hypothetical protein
MAVHFAPKSEPDNSQWGGAKKMILMYLWQIKSVVVHLALKAEVWGT